MAGSLRLVCAIPPHRTGRATFTASGSPSDGINQGRDHQRFRHRRRVHTSLLRRSSLRSAPIRLPPFAMQPAFPTSDYYEGSAPRPALAGGWPTPLPENRTWFPSSRRLRHRAVLGSAYTPGPALCRARHRGTPFIWSAAPLPSRNNPYLAWTGNPMTPPSPYRERLVSASTLRSAVPFVTLTAFWLAAHGVVG